MLEVIAPFKQFGKLRDFMQTKLPPGFPIKLGTFSVYSRACQYVGASLVTLLLSLNVFIAATVTRG